MTGSGLPKSQQGGKKSYSRDPKIPWQWKPTQEEIFYIGHFDTTLDTILKISRCVETGEITTVH